MTPRSLVRPGGAIAARPLHFIWLIDCSGSMSEKGKIQALNHAIREALPHIQREAEANADATLLLRALCFSTGAHWHIDQPTPVGKFRWEDVQADGVTDMGEALRMVAAEMRLLTTRDRVLPPVLVLLSDGQPTDDFDGGLKALLAEPLGRAAVRLAIAIGSDADRERLQEFVADPQRPVLQANEPESLVSFIRWVSTMVVRAVSSPLSQNQTMTGVLQGPQVAIPKPPPPLTGGAVW